MANEVKGLPNFNVGYFWKDTAGQWIFFTLHNTLGVTQSGQAGSITPYLSKDSAAGVAATNSVQEVGAGVYKFQLAQAETNCDLLCICYSHASHFAPADILYMKPDYFTQIAGSGFSAATDALAVLRNRMEVALTAIVRDD